MLIERVDTSSGATALSLYDKRTDDAELHDLAAQFPALRDEMMARVHATFAAHAALRQLPNRAETDSEALRALGYVQ